MSIINCPVFLLTFLILLVFVSGQDKDENDSKQWKIASDDGVLKQIICNDFDPGSENYEDRNFIVDVPANHHAVFPKCCPEGQRYFYTDDGNHGCNSSLPDDQKFGIQMSMMCNNYMLRFSEIYFPKNIVYEDPCVHGKYALDDGDIFGIHANGFLYLKNNDTQQYAILGNDQYCLELMDGAITPFVCFPPVRPKYEFYSYAAVELLSVVFLLITLVVYIFVKELQTIHGRILRCHVACLAVAFLDLAVVQIASRDDVPDELCIAAGYILEFFFLAAFFWLTVMCLEIYKSCAKGYRNEIAYVQELRFRYYNASVWGLTIIITIITLITQFTPIPFNYYRPSIGENSCWFEKKIEQLCFFYLPVGCSIAINIVLFCLTSRRMSKQSDTTYKTLFRKCVVLFMLMGLNWLTELVTWAASEHIPYLIVFVFDIFNASQGIIIFMLFVCYKNWRHVKREISRRRGISETNDNVSEQHLQMMESVLKILTDDNNI